MSDLLKKIKGNTYYVRGAVNSGVYVCEDGRCIVVDTGVDDDAGRKILKAAEAQGWRIHSIINTHAHADHFGGNGLIVRRTGAKVLAPKIEAAIIENPYLEPFYLYSAHPMKALQNKFLMGRESRVDAFVQAGPLDLAQCRLEIIDLNGHSPGQIGVVTPDNVLFSADAYFSSSIIRKYKLPYFVNIGDTIETLNNLRQSIYDYYLPCHGDCTDHISEETEMNLHAIYDTIDVIGRTLAVSMSREELVAKIVGEYNIKLNPGQYYLTVSSISAYLSYMTDNGAIESFMDDNRLKWRKL